jgi:hypothetical protein
MHVKLLILVVAAVTGFVSGGAFAGPTQNEPLAELFPHILTNSTGNGTTLRIPMRPGGDTNTLHFTGTNWSNLGTILGILAGTNIVSNLAERKPLAPGVYLSKPYTCLVIVPDASIDPKICVDPGSRGVDTKMLVQPEVEYVPWPGATIKGPSK